jgi:hypothetical protein
VPTHLYLLELPRVLRARQHEARLFLLQLGALRRHHNAQQLVLEALARDAKV